MTVTWTDTSPSTMPQGGDLAINAGRFRRHIRAVGLSPRTEHSYLESVEAMAPARILRSLLGTWAGAIDAGFR